MYIFATINMFFSSYSTYPCNSNSNTRTFCMHHVYTIWCLYVLCTFTTCCFPFPSVAHLLPHYPFYLYLAGLKQMGPPLCAEVLLKASSCLTGSFSCPTRHCACSKGVQALGSVKRLEKMCLFWHYINKIVHLNTTVVNTNCALRPRNGQCNMCIFVDMLKDLDPAKQTAEAK